MSSLIPRASPLSSLGLSVRENRKSPGYPDAREPLVLNAHHHSADGVCDFRRDVQTAATKTRTLRSHLQHEIEVLLGVSVGGPNGCVGSCAKGRVQVGSPGREREVVGIVESK